MDPIEVFLNKSIRCTLFRYLQYTEYSECVMDNFYHAIKYNNLINMF